MPAAIANNGNVDLFASHREVAWHRLGNVFEEEITDSKKMLVAAGLNDWNIHKVPAILPDSATRFVTPTEHVVATIGGDDIVLGTTGDKFTVVSNEDAFSFLQSLSDGASWETAGAIKDGRLVFGSIALERETVLDKSGVADVVKSYLLIHQRHDGSGSIGGGRTSVRVVCQNTLNVALKGMSQTFKFRHTATVEDRMRQGAEEWRQTNAYFDRFEEEAKELFETTVTSKQYFKTVSDMFPKPDKDVRGAVAKWEKRQEIFTQAWNGAPNAGIKGTAWGMFNALTEANQWGRNMRKGDKGSENFYAAGAGFDIPTNNFRQNAFEISKGFVNA